MTTQTFKYFILIGTMRSGSNLLEEALNQYSDIYCHGELFNPHFVGGPKKEDYLGFTVAKRNKDPKALLSAMRDQSDGNIPGFRYFLDHDQRILNHCLSDPECAKIVLRRDPLESYVSLKIAQETDQWLLRNVPDRKTKKIQFDLQEFRKYQQEQAEFYDDVDHRLKASGQTAFQLQYPQQKDVQILNGLAKFLGSSDELKLLKSKLVRQNPESLRDKVENFDEMLEQLGKEQITTDSAPAAPHRTMRANIPKMVTCMSAPLLFVPIPGGPNAEVLLWMTQIDGETSSPDTLDQDIEDGRILHTGHSQRTLFEWMRANPGVQAFTAVQHPLVRIYETFMTKIFRTGPSTYDAIRQQLITDFGLDLPPIADIDRDRQYFEDIAYDVRRHRKAFHEFLKFVRANLNEQTNIRMDGLWMQQFAFLPGFNSAVPLSVIAYSGQMDSAFRYLEDKVGVASPELGPPVTETFAFSLDEIYTRQTENLCRKAYALDYERFGFDDYQAALEE